MNPTTNEDINELTDQAFGIIREAMNSTDSYNRLQTAMNFVQMLTITAFSDRLKSIERWSDKIAPEDKES